jgi:hypothetical protein
MIPKSGDRFSEKIMLNKVVERDDDSKKNHPAPKWGPVLRQKDMLNQGDSRP